MTDEEVRKLMKRCQIGVGGRNALDEAHSIMAECYGTLGRLLIERNEAREWASRWRALCDEVLTLAQVGDRAREIKARIEATEKR